jgi:hypothetical protein
MTSRRTPSRAAAAEPGGAAQRGVWHLVRGHFVPPVRPECRITTRLTPFGGRLPATRRQRGVWHHVRHHPEAPRPEALRPTRPSGTPNYESSDTFRKTGNEVSGTSSLVTRCLAPRRCTSSRPRGPQAAPDRRIRRACARASHAKNAPRSESMRGWTPPDRSPDGAVRACTTRASAIRGLQRSQVGPRRIAPNSWEICTPGRRSSHRLWTPIRCRW